MTALLIVESPSKVKTIQKYLGNDFVVESSYGHLCGLPPKEMGIDLTSGNYELTYVPTDRGRKQIAKIKQLASRCDELILATDLDREGEAIAWHVARYVNANGKRIPTSRIRFNEITKPALLKALKNRTDIDMALVHAQEARRAADRLIGYSVSPILSASSGARLSAGRVQSPAVRMVVERERAIKNFVATDHFGARLNFTDTNVGDWVAEWNTKPFVNDDNPYVIDSMIAQEASKVSTVAVKRFKIDKAKQSPPAPFITTTLTAYTFAHLNLSDEQTMRHAQSLFEQGLITYHRTDSANLSDEAYVKAVTELQSQNLPYSEKKNMWKSKDNSQEAHEAIRPSDFSLIKNDDSEISQVYNIIRLRALASQMPDAVFNTQQAVLATDKFIYVAKGRQLAVPGWKSLFTDDDTNTDDSEKELPTLTEGQNINVVRGEVLNKKTKAPPRYTPPSLTKKLEGLGIGRPSTYASIFKNIHTRGYVTTKSKKLYATPTGEVILDSLINNFAFIELDYTKNLEDELDQIAHGSLQYVDVLNKLNKDIKANISDVRAIRPTNAVTCPKCNEGYMRVLPINDKKTKKRIGQYFGCSGYPTCKHTMDDDNGVPVETVSHKCPVCHSRLYRKKSKLGSGYFWTCGGYSRFDCRYNTPDVRGTPNPTYPCPSPDCENGRLSKRPPKEKGGKPWWSCVRYAKGCKTTAPDQRNKPDLTKAK